MYNYKLTDWIKAKNQLKAKVSRQQILTGLKKHKGKKAQALYKSLTSYN